MTTLEHGDLVWLNFDPVEGSEQGGRRPAVVVSTSDYMQRIPSVILVLPVTTRDRGLANHVRVDSPETNCLELPSFAMTEQVTTVDKSRVESHAGQVPSEALRSIQMQLSIWLIPR